MTQILEKAAVVKLGALLQEHQAAVDLGRELIRRSVGARIAQRIDDALAAERAEDYFALAVRLEERLKAQL
jgi:hypothetical protein